MKVKKELCVDSYKGAQLAEKYGFDSVELNSSLYVGGLTPRIGLVKKVVKNLDIEIVCMLRNREAGFMYTNEEFEDLLYDLDILLNEDVDAIAFGILTKNYEIDIEKSKIIIEKIHAKNKLAIFHRAFDNTIDYKKAIKNLIELKCDRILTSGQAISSIEGIDTLIDILKIADNKIEIVAGAGINSINVEDFVKKTGVKHVHTSCKGYEEDNTTFLNVSYRIFNNNKYQITDEEEVRKFAQKV